MSDAAEFLRTVPPFDRLEAEALERVAAAVDERAYRAGEDALVEDGPPATHFFVIRSGSMELVHDGEVVDILASREAFGHTSLLSAMSPTFTVRAHEDSTCYLLPREAALDVLGRREGAEYVALTLRERLTRTGHTVHATPQLRALHVEALAGPAVFVEPETAIREVAETMGREHVSSVLVRTRAGLGIVTDHDLREKVVAGDVSRDDAVAAIATAPARTFRDDELAIEAAIEMLNAGVRHLPVVDCRDVVVGVVSAEDLMNLETLSPFALRRSLARARDEEELVAAAGRLPQLFVALVDSGFGPLDVSRVLALQSDTATSRLIDAAVERHGQPPVAWAWLALGSVARRELTLASDQDNALAYGDSDDPAVDAYFERFAAVVNAGLARCGFGEDHAAVLARDRRWRMTRGEWARVFAECLVQPDRSHLVRAAVSFDFRHVIGGLEIVSPLVEIVRRAPRHRGFVRQLARTATDYRPPLGFRGRVVTSDADGQRGVVDIKLGGVVPIANLARFHAIANGVTISATLDRLSAVEELGALRRDEATSLREAFGVVSEIRLAHQADCVRAGRPPDNLVDPGALTPFARTDLREVFHAIAASQKRLGHYVPLGISR